MKVCRLVSIHSVLEPKFVCPMHSEAKQRETSVFGAEKGLLQGPTKENGQLMLKNAKLSDGFWGRVFIGRIWGKGCRMWNLPLIGWW